MSERPQGLCTMISHMCKQGINGNRYRFAFLLPMFFLLWALSGCGSGAPEFPPTVETVQTVAEELGWVVNLEETQSWAEDQILYTLEFKDQTKVSVSCALVEGNRVLTGNCVVTLLQDKPQFTWEDWREVVTLLEALYGGFSEELYQTLSEQEMPEPEIPLTGPDTPIGQESLSWEAECPTGYGRVHWSISAGTVERNFPSPIIHDWRITFNTSLYESKEAYEDIDAASEIPE